ncbi:hypothetical protein DGG96_11090 [Legionella qingyii]|uniref:Uncharacterized protein n=1 Tax=Legionella qingyii TaxID=2184757 RepID=A0A317U1L4_9GAMM|nr:hypothetical protein [Legionella qingyii]PWY55641.1 hypothetical protein DGG96_11090 [Legionella qingyii]RUR21764.1 hypothetical protein ELY20_11080 [Legionella qingyii]RUR25308.1 hypothetical protein ELY16_10270 [Legionella qingyii]
MHIDFSLLRLLHVYDYQKPKEEQCPLDLFRTRINPIEFSTCMRHLYLFTAVQVGEHDEFYNQTLLNLRKPRLHQKLPHTDALEGTEAYSFLLFWAIGGLNKKKPFNDERILGDLRRICRSYEVSTSPYKKESWKQNQAVAQALLTDVKYLLKLTKFEMPLEEKIERLKKVCDHCTWVRENGFFDITQKIDYASFLDKKEMYVHLYGVLEIARKKLDTELDKISLDKTSLLFLFSNSADRLQEKIRQIEQLQTLLTNEEPSLVHNDELKIK